MSQALICLANCDSFICVRCVSSDILASSALTSHQLRLIQFLPLILIKDEPGVGGGWLWLRRRQVASSSGRESSRESRVLIPVIMNCPSCSFRGFVVFEFQPPITLQFTFGWLFRYFLIYLFFLTFCCAFASSHQLNNINSTLRWKSQRELISYPRVVIKYANAIKHS